MARRTNDPPILLVEDKDSLRTMLRHALDVPAIPAGGLDIERLTKVKKDTGRVTDYDGGVKKPTGAWIDYSCDIFVPAARPKLRPAPG